MSREVLTDEQYGELLVQALRGDAEAAARVQLVRNEIADAAAVPMSRWVVIYRDGSRAECSAESGIGAIFRCSRVLARDWRDAMSVAPADVQLKLDSARFGEDLAAIGAVVVGMVTA